MKATYQTRIETDPAAGRALSAYAQLYGHVERRLFAAAAAGEPFMALKGGSLVHHGISSRFFNSVKASLEGKVKAVQAAQAAQKLRIDGVKRRIAKAECRRDAQHKFSNAAVRSASAVYVGNVPVKLLTSGSQAKSGYDAGIYSLKTMLRYKCEHAGIDYQEVSEAFSTQVCSACGTLPPTSPKGRADLGVRQWRCCQCGTLHDRDLNAALNIASG